MKIDCLNIQQTPYLELGFSEIENKIILCIHSCNVLMAGVIRRIETKANLVLKVFGFSQILRDTPINYQALSLKPNLSRIKGSELRINLMDNITTTNRKGLSREIAALMITHGHSSSYHAANDLFKDVRKHLNLSRPSESSKDKRYRLTMDEFILLLRAGYGHSNPQYGLMIKTLFQTGAREKAFRPLALKNFILINVKGKQTPTVLMDINVKFNKPYSTPITWQLYDEIQTFAKLTNRTENEPLFQPWWGCSGRTRAFSKTRLWEIIKELCIVAGIQGKVSAHSIRYVVAQMLYDNGMTMEEIRVFMNHKNIETTKKYVQEGPGQIAPPYQQAMKEFCFVGGS